MIKQILRKIIVTIGSIIVIAMASVLIVAVHVVKFFRKRFIYKNKSTKYRV